MVNAGLGFGGIFDDDFYGNPSPMLSASFEHGLWDIAGPGVISLGGYLGFQGHKDYDYGSSERWRYTVVGVRGNYHYNGLKQVPKLDLYAGTMISYNFLRYSYTDSYGKRYKSRSNGWGSGLGLTAYAGGRWFFNEKFAGYVELGYGVTAISLGGSFKF
ncbi:MAG: hypothetical protein LRY55_01985 [Leadbetterella sp.]|nr:hypothetical protein [Leadbetterella sp.]